LNAADCDIGAGAPGIIGNDLFRHPGLCKKSGEKDKEAFQVGKKACAAVILLGITILLLPFLVPHQNAAPHYAGEQHTAVKHTQVRDTGTAARDNSARPGTFAAEQIDIRITDSDRIIQNAYRKRLSNIQVQGQGIVSKTLSDDLDGARHQRFILRLSTGQTLLVAHNIDLAPRINTLSSGDAVKFYGVYEWNEKGGVIHWTHHDPRGRHAAGWLWHNGRTYQ
jgi:hypothetical protein